MSPQLSGKVLGMKLTSHLTALCGAALAITSASQAFAAADPVGVWIDDTGRGAVEIKSCGPNLCGYVVAVKNADDTKGCGKQIIGDAKPVGNGRWDQGWIYSPERRKNYDVELKPLTNGTLRVVGYAGTKLFSRTMIWTAAPADLKRCDAQQAATPPAVVTPPVAAVKPAVTASKQATETPAATASPATSATASTTPAAAAPAPAVVAKVPAAAADADKQASGKTAAAPAPEVAAQAPPAASAPTDAPANEPTDQANAEPGNNDGGEAPGVRSADEGFKIGDLDLDKVLTRSPSGKCKLDLPWVKVQFDCGQDD
jgi:uncharacterized protein (DUF2147 family)